ncbi:MAG: sulfurtransferase TusA family protein [Egibacteraceae bacterium]
MDPPTLVDALGKPCPLPVIELAKAVEQASVGDEVVVLSDDAGAKVDIPVWCRMKGHTYLGLADAEVGWSFRVRRSA